MKMTNNEIYGHAASLAREFDANIEQSFPVKVNFYLLKNRNILYTLAQDIEKLRSNILSKYGTLNQETNQYEFSNEYKDLVLQELNDLFSLEQEVNIYKINIDVFPDNLFLTTGQMEALMFMIE